MGTVGCCSITAVAFVVVVAVVVSTGPGAVATIFVVSLAQVVQHDFLTVAPPPIVVSVAPRCSFCISCCCFCSSCCCFCSSCCCGVVSVAASVAPFVHSSCCFCSCSCCLVVLTLHFFPLPFSENMDEEEEEEMDQTHSSAPTPVIVSVSREFVFGNNYVIDFVSGADTKPFHGGGELWPLPGSDCGVCAV